MAASRQRSRCRGFNLNKPASLSAGSLQTIQTVYPEESTIPDEVLDDRQSLPLSTMARDARLRTRFSA